MIILIAPNGFKECASPVQTADLLVEKLRKFLPENIEVEFLKIPLSDGGDGFLDVLSQVYSLRILALSVTAPWLTQRISVEIGYSRQLKTVFLESARIVGLKLIPPEKRNPARLSSVGFGEIISKLVELKSQGKLEIEDVVVGVGGTGTNDLGLGALESLGLELSDENGKRVDALPINFPNVVGINKLPVPLPFGLKFVTDVENPLLGEFGATRVYGKQKGIKERDFNLFEKGFERIIEIAGISESERKSLSGAGGGLAAGFQIFYDSEILPAREFIKETLGLRAEKVHPDLIITVEGRFDEQSLMGKGVGVIFEEFPTVRKVIVCGVASALRRISGVKIIELTNYFSSVAESIERFEEGIEKAAREIVKIYLKK